MPLLIVKVRDKKIKNRKFKLGCLQDCKFRECKGGGGMSAT